jgi:hypothetical protein
MASGAPVLIPTDPLDAAALALALLPGQRRQLRSTVEIDWNRDGGYSHALSDVSAAVGNPSMQWELADGAPGSMRVQSGTSSRTLTLIMNGHVISAGQWMPVAEVFAPYNTASPLYGVRKLDTPVRWTISVATSRGWIPTRQFTGTIGEPTVQRSSNTVTIVCSDIPPTLRGPVHYPSWAVDGAAAGRMGSDEAMRGLASAVVDGIFNAAGLLTRPRPPWVSSTGVLAMCWLPLTGSFAPAVGKQLSQAPWGNFQLFPSTYNISPGRRGDGLYWIDGPFGQARNSDALTYPGSLIYTGRDTQPLIAGRSTGMSAWIYCGPTVAGYDPTPAATLRQPVLRCYFGFVISGGNYYAQRISIASNGSVLQLQVETGGTLIYRADWTPPSTAWRHVWAQVDHSGASVTAKLIVDGVTQISYTASGSSNSEAATALNVLFFPQEGIHWRGGVPMADAMAWQETGAPVAVPERTVTALATVDRSLNEISYVPPPGPTAWDDLKALTSAESASISTDAYGQVHWRNRVTARSSATPETITLASPSDVGTVESQADHVNTVQITTQPGQASWQVAWTLPAVDTMPVPVGASTWIFPTDPTVIAIETGTVPRLYQSLAGTLQGGLTSTLPAWFSSVDSGYVFVYDGTETEEWTNQLMVDTSNQSGLNDGQRVRIAVSDTGALPGRFRLISSANTDPQPALRIAGLILAKPPGDTATITWPETLAADGGAVLPLSLAGGDWYQDLASVTATAMFLLRRASQQIPTFNTFDTVGDPRRDVADPCLLLLGDNGQRVVGFHSAITRSFTGSQLRDTLTIRATHGPRRWALGDAVYGQLGSSAILG